MSLSPNSDQPFPEDSNLIFVSDGIGSLHSDIVTELKTAGVNITAFGIGERAGMGQLQRIDPDATRITKVQEIVEVFQGIDSRFSTEPLLDHVTVYLDLDNDGTLDTDEPSQLTQPDNSGSLLGTTSYTFTFDNLLPGTYTVRQIVPSGYSQTTPATAFVDTVTSAGETYGHLFGLHQVEQTSNHKPVFRSDVPTAPIKVGERFRYHAEAIDLDADALTYNLAVKPQGMSISDEGVIVWKPTAEQTGTFDVIVRVQDGQGGVDLQAFQVTVDPANHAPSFISVPPSSAPQVNRLFQYQSQATDLDGDTLTYSLLPSNRMPAGVTIDAATGLLSWRPTAVGGASNLGGEVQPWQITIRATDAQGGEAFQTLNLVVAPTQGNQAPTITSQPRTTVRLGNPYFYQIKAADGDGDRLSYTLSTAPAGMKLQGDILTWTPTAEQFGDNAVVIQVSDSQGGSVQQAFTSAVTNQATNYAPSITSTPNRITNLEREYQYNLTGTDPDGDLFLWSLMAAPEGMLIDATTGALRWQPQESQLGTHDVTVRLIDALGSYREQTFTLTVNGSNLAPVIQSVPVTRAAQDQPYRYTVMASDPESDALNFSLSQAPAGMTISSSGVIQWTPAANQLGKQQVEVLVSDRQGATSSQVFTIEAGTMPINQAPTIASKPTFVAPVGSPYHYQVQASDPDEESLTYRLLDAPEGMTIDSTTGLVSWETPVAGYHKVVVGVEDARGLGAAQGFTLTARVNREPIVQSTPSLTIVAGSTYGYDLIARDPDGDRLSYSLDGASFSKGMTLDGMGRLRWSPTAAQIGAHDITLTATDALGASITQTFTLAVQADTEKPLINLTANVAEARVGDSVTFRINATDNVAVTSLELQVNGQNYAIDPNGLAIVQVSEDAPITAVVIAKDGAGNSQTQSFTVTIAPENNQAPIVHLNLQETIVNGERVGLDNGMITAPTNILGTVDDPDNNLDYYTLEVASLEDGVFREIYRSQSGVDPIADGVLNQFDPTLLQNDSYTLRLTAYDKSGFGSSTEGIVEVSSELKLGNFRLSFTDLSIPVTGIPITLIRTYDSLTSNTSDDFGYGWRMEFRDTDLRTSLGRDRQYEEFGVRSQAFDDKTRVYITLPGGKREGFTFKPQRVEQVDGQPLGLFAKYMYAPEFVADKGSTNTLTVEQAYITKGSNGKYYGLNQSGYNPADAESGFGGVYVLTTKEGTQYRIDAATGDLLTVSDTNGNTLTYSDDAVSSSTGKTVTFERDAQGRIAAVKDPMGDLIRYGYNSAGDLVSVTDREGNTTQLEYNDDRAHYLDKIVDPLGRDGVRTEYDEAGRLKYMVDAAGQRVEMGYDPANSKQTVYDQLGNSTTYVYDDRGNILTEIDAVGKVTTRTYDNNNNVLSETATIVENGQTRNFTTTYTYDSKNNQLSRTNPLNQIDYYTYNSRRQLLTSTDALGNTTTYAFDSQGNVTSKTDAAGYTISYTYDRFGNPETIIEGANDVTKFEYDQLGLRTKKTDALGREALYTYDANGNQLTETWTQTTPEGLRTLQTTKTYDANGKVETLLDAEGGLTQYDYDANGNQTLVIDALGRRTEMRYNDRNQLTETILPDQTPDTLLDNPRIKYGYDAVGNKTSITDQQGRTTAYTYDPLNRPTGMMLPDDTPNNPDDNLRVTVDYNPIGWMTSLIKDGITTEFEYDAAGRMILTRNRENGQIYETKTSYDAAGRKVAVIDSLNHTTRYVYDSMDRLIETIYADNTSTKTTYNTAGKVLSQSDQLNRTTWFEYDPLDQLTAVIDAKQNRMEYRYDEAGNLVYQEDANDHVTRFEYDGLGRRTAVVRPLNQRSETSYDKVGNVIEAIDFNGETIRYDYDPTNHLTAKHFLDEGRSTLLSYTDAGQRDTVTDQRGITDYDYDTQGRLVTRTDPDGKAISYTYDPVTGKVATIATSAGTTTYQYNSLGQLKTVTAAEGQTSYTYDAMGNLETVVLPNGNTQTYQYDLLNRLELLQTKDGNGNLIASYSYGYDAMGNRTSVEELGGRNVEYTYDELNRLTKEAITDAVNGNQTIEYAYDNVGNRSTKKETSEGQTIQTTYIYDENDRLLNETTSGVTTAYTYDNNGNLITKQALGQQTTYDWDSENHLIGADITSTAGTKQLEYQYDVDGVRVISTVNGSETRYLVDTNRPYAQVLEEYTSAGGTQVSYAYGQQLISQTHGEDSVFYLYDGHSGVRQLSDESGQVTDAYTYDAYGNVVQAIGETENSYLYRGEPD